MNDFFLLFNDVFNIFSFLGKYFVFWSPFVFGAMLWWMWLRYIRGKWRSDINWVLLEIKLPKDIKRTPLAMEVVLSALYQTHTGEWHEHLFQGRAMDSFSLEIVSIEGSVHFFIRTRDIFKNFVESQIYSQYPEVEIYEAPDYSRYVDYHDNSSEWQLWGQEYQFTKPDAYPIKTYVDFGLDKEGLKDEEKVDPLVATLELLGSLGKNEQLWVQILIQSTNKRFRVPGSRFKKRDWRGEGEDLIEEIVKKRMEKSGVREGGNVMLTPVEDEVVKAIQRNISKLGFDCGIRSIYWFKKDVGVDLAKIPSRIMGLLSLFNQYDSRTLNSFRPSWVTDFDDPWEDFKGIRLRGKKRTIFNAYKRRSYFYPPHKRKPLVLNIEELATLYHFPGAVAETPTFGRIDSRKGEAPINLPT